MIIRDTALTKQDSEHTKLTNGFSNDIDSLIGDKGKLN